jgi:SAM-dependent methyltransferase
MDADEPHSQLYFTDLRDHWWNDDYVALLARRSGLDRARRVLDVGSGQGHFSRLWAPHLVPDFELVGVEPEAQSRAVADERCRAFVERERSQGTFRFLEGRAESLPFPDGSFDAAICQTVLIHVPDPARVVAEMTRVVRTGGVVLAAEPNNLNDLQRFAARGPEADPADLLRDCELIARCIRGKVVLGEGWNNLGARLPAFFTGLENVRFYQSDRPFVMTPPYATAPERASLADTRDFDAKGIWSWRREETRQYWTAGGGDPARFDAEYDAALARQRDELARLDRGEWTELTAMGMLIAIGNKRAA